MIIELKPFQLMVSELRNMALLLKVKIKKKH